MEDIGNIIKRDRVNQGLSLRGLAERLNQDTSVATERTVTTSWLHHLENGRAKPLSPDMKRCLARALGQEETKYLEKSEFPQSRREGFVRFFDDQLGAFETGSTLVCDISTDFSKPDDLGELLICFYHFLLQTGGSIIAFERSNHFVALPVLLTAMRVWPDVNDVNLQEVVSRILTPKLSGGFVECPLATPGEEILDWVTKHVDLYEVTADEQVTALLSTDLFSTMVVISPNQRHGRMPARYAYYYLGRNDYGLLSEGETDLVYRRFEQYRDLEIFSKVEYEGDFVDSYGEWGRMYRLVFGGADRD